MLICNILLAAKGLECDSLLENKHPFYLKNILWARNCLFLSSSPTPGGLQPRQGCSLSSSGQKNTTTHQWVCLHISLWALHYRTDCPHIYATNQSASLRPLMGLPPSTLQTLDVNQTHASRCQEIERAREKYADCHSPFTLICKRVDNIAGKGIIRRTTTFWDNITGTV